MVSSKLQKVDEKMIETDFSEKTPADLEKLKSSVGRYFPFYEVKVGREGIVFFCKINEERLEEDFESLRIDLSHQGYIPILKNVSGETAIYVVPKPEKRNTPTWVNLVLLAATIITTALTGALLVSGKTTMWDTESLMVILRFENLLNGFLLFSLPLLTILGIHEMGHYYVSKMHGIKTSLPFFIPVPPILNFNIGTFGALISSRDPLSNRKILFDVGIAGPLAGFIVAVPITIYGVMTSTVVPLSSISKGELMLGSSLFFDMIYKTFVNIPPGYTLSLNPVAFAGWVGLLITSINLIPAGQLDGGHIARAVLGEKQKYAGWFSIFILLFTGWWFFAIFIVLLLGTAHPPPLNDISPIDTKRKILFFVALLILVLCFVLFPIYPADMLS